MSTETETPHKSRRLIVLATGCLRSFNTNLPNLVSMFRNEGYEPVFYLVISNATATDRYLWPTNSSNITSSVVKEVHIVDDTSASELDKTHNSYNNMFAQWYKVQCAFRYAVDNLGESCVNDIFIKIRTDLLFSNSEWMRDACVITEVNTIKVPFKDSIFVTHEKLGLDRELGSLNDCVAICDYEGMMRYSNFYDYLVNIKDTADFGRVSEVMLYKYLINTCTDVKVSYCNINYKLVLSQCFIIAISGDSGSGKTTLSKMLQNVMPYDNTVVLETDRYHKWERGDSNYEVYTHLHPEANYLEKMTGDVFNLKLGNTIHQVDYDHSNGKFTAPEPIVPKNNVIICGLHTLYDQNLLNLVDLRIYVDTEVELQVDWKLKRDLGRGHTAEKIMQSIQKRAKDRENYIVPQRDNANFVINHVIDECSSAPGVRFIARGDIAAILRGVVVFEVNVEVDEHTSGDFVFTVTTPDDDIKDVLTTYWSKLSLSPEQLNSILNVENKVNRVIYVVLLSILYKC